MGKPMSSAFELPDIHTCKILVTRIGLLRLTVISGLYIGQSEEEEHTDSNLIENHQLRNARRNGPLVCKH